MKSAPCFFLQTYWRFRTFDQSRFIWNPDVYQDIVDVMASGATFGHSFRGPLSWSGTGALNGRMPAAMQSEW